VRVMSMALIVLGLSLAGCGKKSSPSLPDDWESSRIAASGGARSMDIGVPPGWSEVPVPPQTEASFAMLHEGSPGFAACNVMARPMPDMEGATPEEGYTVLRAYHQDKGRGPDVARDVQVSGYPGIITEQDETREGTTVRHQQTMVMVDGVLYQLTCSTGADIFEQRARTFAQVLASIRIRG